MPTMKHIAAGFSVLALAGAAYAGGMPESQKGAARQAEERERTFLTLDDNRDGEVTRQEARDMPSLSQRFQEVDKDGSGRLSRYEFNTFMSGAAAGATAAAEEPARLFQLLDKDGNGAISRAEAANMPELSRNFKEVDKDGNEQLSRAEFTAVNPAALSTK